MTASEFIGALSPTQVRLLAAHGTACPETTFRFKLRGRVEVERLRAALTDVIRRHEILRTELIQEPGGRAYLQRVRTAAALHWREVARPFTGAVDLAPARSDQRVLQAYWSAQPDGGELVVSAPAYLLDLASGPPLLREIAQAYSGESDDAGQLSQYMGIAAWLNANAGDENAHAEKEYWTAGDASAPRCSSSGEPFAWQVQRIALPTVSTAALAEASLRWAVSPRAALLAVWAALVARHDANGRPAIGVRFDGRNHPELVTALGPLSQYLPISAASDGNQPLSELAARLQSQLDSHEELQEYAHLSDDEPNPSHYRWAYQFDGPVELCRTPDCTFELMERSGISERFIMLLSAVQRADTLEARLAYDSREICVDDAREIGEQLGTALEQLARGDAERVCDLRFMTSEKRRAVIQRSRDRSWTPIGGCFHRHFSSQAVATRDAIAVECADGHFSYAALDQQSDEAARLLLAIGCGAGDRVALLLDVSMEALVWLLASLKVGAAFVPISPLEPSARATSMLEAVEPAVVVSRRCFLERMSSMPWKTMDAGNPQTVAEQTSESARTSSSEASVAYVMFTSGSTGSPKGVMISNASLMNYLLWAVAEYRLREGSGTVVHTEMSVDLTLTSLLAPLLCGQRVRIFSSEQRMRLASAFAAVDDMTLLKLTPSHLRMLAVEAAAAPLSIVPRQLVVGGEQLYMKDLIGWGMRATRSVNEYGPTEATVACTLQDIAELAPGEASASIPIGRPIAGAGVYVLDELLEPVPTGAVGELYIDGPGLAQGYLDAPAPTARLFVPNPFAEVAGARMYRSGDLGRYRANGTIEFLGRRDAQVKVRGRRVELGEIEAQLAANPKILRCAVALETSGSGSQLVAYVTCRRGSESEAPTTGELQRFLRERLPEHMVPPRYLEIGRFPEGRGGKIDRGALCTMEARPLKDVVYRRPANPSEEVLAAVWAKLLGVDRVGRDDNFFRLGGDSIRAVQVVAEARGRGLALSLEGLMQSATLADTVLTASGQTVVDERYVPKSLLTEADRALLPVEVEDAFPLAKLQAGMIFAAALFERSAIYHDVASYHLRARLDREALYRAVQIVVSGHSALRTRFDLTTFSEPLQLVMSECSVPVRFFEAKGLSADQQKDLIGVWMDEERADRIGSDTFPLIRFAVHVFGPNEFQFSLGFHHAIFDGWSEAVLLTEIFQAYFRDLHGQPATPSAESFAMPNFVRMERELMQNPAVREFWRERAERWPVLRLPRVDGPTRAVRSVATVGVPVPDDLGLALHELARVTCVPIKTVLLAVHVMALGSLSAMDAVTTCAVTSGRPEQTGADRAIGLFLNSVPLHVRLGCRAVQELVERCFDSENEVLPVRRYPLAEIKKAFGGVLPSEALFYFTHYHVFRELMQNELEVLGDRYYEETTFPFVANFWVNPFDNCVRLNLTCEIGRLDEEFVAAAVESYRQALDAIASGSVLKSPLAGAGRAPSKDDLAALVSDMRSRHQRRAEPRHGAALDQHADFTSEVIAEIWADVLSVSSVRTQEEFFAAGGDSIAATRMVSMIRSRLGIDIPVALVFDNPTFSAFASAVALRRLECEGKLGSLRVERASPELDSCPLSSTQLEIFAFESIRPGTAAFHVPAAFRLQGPLDLAALRVAIVAVARRHGALRARIVGGAEPFQVVGDSLPELTLVDLSMLDSDERRVAANEIARSVVLEPFDLGRAPLFRVVVLRAAEDDHDVVAVFHHLVVDAWSMAIVAREVSASYAQLVAGVPAQLDASPLQYGDFVMWERTIRSDDDRSQINRAAILRPCAPQSHSTPLRAGVVTAGALRNVCRAHDATPFSVLLSALVLADRSLTESDEFAIATDYVARPGPDLQGIVGAIAAQVAIIGAVDGTWTVADMLRSVRDSCRFVLDGHTRHHRTPLATKFVFNANPVGWDLVGTRMTPIEIERGAPKTNVLWNLTIQDGELAGSVEYAASGVDSDLLLERVRRFEDAVKLIVAGSNGSVREAGARLRDWGDERRRGAQARLSAETAARFGRVGR